MELEGVRVIVSRQVCALYRVGQARRKGIKLPVFRVNTEKCTGCKICINTFGCPAISWDSEAKKAKIDPTMCWGCGSCSQICPYGAFEVVREAK